MRVRDRLALAGLVLVLVAVAAGLVVSVSAGPKPTPAPVHDTYREGVLGHPSSINPLTARSQVDQDLVSLLFRGLVRSGRDGTLLPDLALYWTTSSDGRTYTFQLREDAYWEDGQPVTSADVVFTIGLVQDPKYDGPLGSSWQGIKATASGPYTVQFSMALAQAGFLREASLPILPEHLLRNVPVEKLADTPYSSNPVGDGPYKIVTVDWSHALLARVTSVSPPISASPSVSSSASQILSPSPTASPTPAPTLEPSTEVGPIATASPSPTATPSPTPPPTPLAQASGLTYAAPLYLDLRFYDDAGLASDDFKGGRLDGVGGLDPLSTEAAATRSGARVVTYPWASLIAVAVNQQSDAVAELRDVNVRTALLAAVDRRFLLYDIMHDRGSMTDLPLPSWSPYYDAQSITATPYSLTDAITYLGDAGWTQQDSSWLAPRASAAESISLLVPQEADAPVMYRTGKAVAGFWSKVGLTVTLEAVPLPTYVSRLARGDFSTAIVDYEVGLDPDLGAFLLSSQYGSGGSNVAGVKDSTLDKLILTARKAVDPTARKAAMSAFEKYVSTALPVLPLFFRDYELVISDEVAGMVPTELADPSGRYWDVIDWRLANGR